MTQTTTTSYCFEDTVAWEPLDMRGTAFTTQLDAEACRLQCLKTPGCFHFSYWTNRGDCHLQDAFALRQEGRADFISGPFQCWGELGEVSEFAKMAQNQYLPKELDCMEVGVTWEPTLEWRHKSIFRGSQLDIIRECQDLCARNQECRHFTMDVMTDDCKLSPDGAVPLPGVFNTISGPPKCEGGEVYAFMRKFGRSWPLPSMGPGTAALLGVSAVSVVGMFAGIALKRFHSHELAHTDLRMVQLIVHDPDDLPLGAE